MADEAVKQELNTTILSEEARSLENFLLSKIIGQDRAVRQFVKTYQQIAVGLSRENHPAGVFLFAGPTGVGKTQLVRSLAGYLFGDENSITRIDCSEFQKDHEISKLIGSPPGYVGFNDKNSARMSQENIDRYQTPEHKINIVLFDEIEEAHEALHSAILQILDAGRLTLGNNNTTDFSKTIVVMTSNIGEKEIQQKLTGRELGLRPSAEIEAESSDNQVYKASKKALSRFLKPKFMNRIDRVIIFHTLNAESLRTLIKNELRSIQIRVWKSAISLWMESGMSGSAPIFKPEIKTTGLAQQFLLKEGTSAIYGARELNRALDRFVVFPLSSLIGSKQVESDDIIEIDYKEGNKKLTFSRVGKRDIQSAPPSLIDPTTPVGSNGKGPRDAWAPWTKDAPPKIPDPGPRPRKPYDPSGLYSKLAVDETWTFSDYCKKKD